VRAFLQRHGDLLGAVPEWTVQLLFFKRVGALGASFREGSWRVKDEAARWTRRLR
jgi:hypothetical protein